MPTQPPGARAQVTGRTQPDNDPARPASEGLPEGARLRLGSVSLRHAGDVTGLAFDEAAGRLVSRSPADGQRRWFLDSGAAEGRSLTSPHAGTTHDTVDTALRWRGQHDLVLLDTAGIDRRAHRAQRCRGIFASGYCVSELDNASKRSYCSR